jgi:hypothetical protein
MVLCMADDPNVVSKTAIFQSITTEAGGFYTTVTTVASAFLGASLLFIDKFVSGGSAPSLVFLGLSWISLVVSLGCVSYVRYLNLQSGRLALEDDIKGAGVVDLRSRKILTASLVSLILGMTALVFVGLVNVNNLARKENTMDNPSRPLQQTEQKTIPYGSLSKPDCAAAQTPPPTSQPTTSQPDRKD